MLREDSDRGNLRASVDEMAMWAKAASSSAVDNVLEWLAFGIAAAAAYLLFAPWQPKPFGLFDEIMIGLLLGNGMVVAVFEFEVARALRDLVKGLQGWQESTDVDRS
jgi:hypothetical protein